MEVPRCNRMTLTDPKIQTKQIPKAMLRGKTEIHNPKLLSKTKVEVSAEVVVKVDGMVPGVAKAEVVADAVEDEDSQT